MFLFYFAALGIVLAGVLMLVTPWVTDLWLLVVITTVTGLMFGYFDAGECKDKYYTNIF